MTPNFPLGPPPAPDDPRRHEWDALLWAWLRQLSQAGGSTDIIADRVFRQHDITPGEAPGLDVAEKQLILATQIYGS